MNPTRPRLEYIAKESSPWVMKKVIGEWLATIGLENEWPTGRGPRVETFLTGEQVLKRAASIPAIASRMSGISTVDRYLPWYAAYLRRVEKEIVKQVRQIGWQALQDREVKDAIRLDPKLMLDIRDPQSWMTPGEVIQRVRTVKTIEDIAAALATSRRFGAYGRSMNQKIMGIWNAYKIPEEGQLRLVADWAEATRPQLQGLAFPAALALAETWAEEQRSCEPMPEGNIVYRWPDGWTMREIVTQQGLTCEGEEQRHCVDEQSITDYTVLGGDLAAFSLRDPNNRPKATMIIDVKRNHVPEHWIRGFANMVPRPPYLLRLWEFRRALMPGGYRYLTMTPGTPSAQCLYENAYFWGQYNYRQEGSWSLRFSERFKDTEEAEKWERVYLVGAEAEGWIDPANPKEADEKFERDIQQREELELESIDRDNIDGPLPDEDLVEVMNQAAEEACSDFMPDYIQAEESDALIRIIRDLDLAAYATVSHMVRQPIGRRRAEELEYDEMLHWFEQYSEGNVKGYGPVFFPQSMPYSKYQYRYTSSQKFSEALNEAYRKQTGRNFSPHNKPTNFWTTPSLEGWILSPTVQPGGEWEWNAEKLFDQGDVAIKDINVGWIAELVRNGRVPPQGYLRPPR